MDVAPNLFTKEPVCTHPRKWNQKSQKVTNDQRHEMTSEYSGETGEKRLQRQNASE